MPLRVVWGCSGCIVGAASARAPHSRAAAVSAASTALRQRMHVQQQHYHTRKEQGGGPALKYIHSTEVNMACTASLRNGFTRGTGAVTTHSGHYCQGPQTRQQQQQQRHRHLSTTASRLKINPAWTKRQKATTPPPAPTPAEVLQTLPPFTLSAEKQIRPEAQAVMAALDSKVVGHQEIKDALLIVSKQCQHLSRYIVYISKPTQQHFVNPSSFLLSSSSPPPPHTNIPTLPMLSNIYKNYI